jgi:hypothetical protein
LTATDAQNASDTDSIAIMVVDPPLNLPPVVQITSPTHHQAHLLNLPMSLTGIAADPEGQTALTYRWTVERFNEGQIELGTAPSITWTPTDNYTFNVEGIYTFQVRLFVTDPGGSEGVDTVELEWILIF